jgi:hypothetical protein
MKSKKEQPPVKKQSSIGVLVVAGALVLTSGIVWVVLQSNGGGSSSAPSIAPPPLVATLSPDLFTGRVRDAYQAAKEIPDILKYLPCYCGCFAGLQHQNNLFCFADKHGEICDMCQTIALEAKKMNGEGMPVEKIGEAIRTRYGPSAH